MGLAAAGRAPSLGAAPPDAAARERVLYLVSNLGDIGRVTEAAAAALPGAAAGADLAPAPGPPPPVRRTLRRVSVESCGPTASVALRFATFGTP